MLSQSMLSQELQYLSSRWISKMKPQLSPKEIQELHELYHDPSFVIEIAEHEKQDEFLDGADPAQPTYLEVIN